ncbi:hypothetical protein Q9R29_05850 [Rothia sp. ARF10]|nr:hypothetical protein [Rothia sp. ARF10]
MNRARAAKVLAAVLGVLYVLAGIAETIRAVRSGDGGIPFWFGTLVGGGTLVLAGLLQGRRHERRGRTLVVGGALLGMPGTLWSIVVPLLAVAVVILTLAAGPTAGTTDVGRATRP